MIYVNVATSNIRGFLKNLFDYPFQKIKFVYENNTVYEVPKVTRKLLSKGIKLKVFDILGVYQIVDAESMKEDISFSYNRFLKTKKPYIILLENPSALVNYCWDRPKYRIARRKLKNCFQDTLFPTGYESKVLLWNCRMSVCLVRLFAKGREGYSIRISRIGKKEYSDSSYVNHTITIYSQRRF